VAPQEETKPVPPQVSGKTTSQPKDELGGINGRHHLYWKSPWGRPSPRRNTCRPKPQPHLPPRRSLPVQLFREVL